ncbi:MAG TPA: (deoxy)nucleoside triphosphate pyrophosphohydrolase [Polyangiaceae bacterium]|nr:(deoxy)nucleoside triphosphate pyrophosphohydrolase [Polyangiaceae bacterium]
MTANPPPTIDVAIALVFRGSRVLVTRRREGTHLGGFWEFPGGKIEPNETPEAAAERELMEEVELRVLPRARGSVIEHAYATRRVRLHPVYCSSEHGEARLREVAEARWVDSAELATLHFPEANRSLLAELEQRRWPPF